jgi:hypothetical protein
MMWLKTGPAKWLTFGWDAALFAAVAAALVAVPILGVPAYAAWSIWRSCVSSARARESMTHLANCHQASVDREMRLYQMVYESRRRDAISS